MIALSMVLAVLGTCAIIIWFCNLVKGRSFEEEIGLAEPLRLWWLGLVGLILFAGGLVIGLGVKFQWFPTV
jgi:hypothetical protein